MCNKFFKYFFARHENYICIVIFVKYGFERIKLFIEFINLFFLKIIERMLMKIKK